MLKYWVFLALNTMSDPRGVLGDLRKRGYALPDIAQAAALLSAIGVIFYEASLLLSRPDGENQSLIGITSPLAQFMFQYVIILITAIIVWFGGRIFHGQASFSDSLLAVTWLQFVMLIVQVIQIAAFVLVPPLGSLMFLVAVALLMYLLINFIMEIHGFKNALAVVAGVIGGFFALALVLSILLAIFGVALVGVPENV